MEQEFLYNRYSKICIPENEFNSIIEAGYITDEFKYAFEGEFLEIASDFSIEDNENLDLIEDFLYSSESVFLHNLSDKSFKEMSFGYFFSKYFLIIVPIGKSNDYVENEKTQKFIIEKTDMKPIFIPLYNVLDVEYIENGNEEQIVITYIDNMQDVISFKENDDNFSNTFLNTGASMDKKNYKEIAEMISHLCANAISFDVLEELLIGSFDDTVPKDTFKISKYSLITYDDFNILDTIWKYKDNILDNDILFEEVKKYIDANEKYDEISAERKALFEEREKANIFKRHSVEKKIVEINNRIDDQYRCIKKEGNRVLKVLEEGVAAVLESDSNE